MIMSKFQEKLQKVADEISAYSTADNSKRVTSVSQFTTVEQEREGEIERLGKR